MRNDTDNRLGAPLVRLLVVMMVGGVLALLDATIVNVGIGALAREFHSPLGTIEWVSTAYLLAVAVSIPLAGWAVDRFGGRAVWLAGLSVFLLGSVLASIAWSVGSLIAFRVVQGLGGGIMEPTRLTILARTAGPRRAGRVIGLVAISSTIGPVLGPICGGLILEHLDWRWMFLVNLPIGLVALVLAARIVPADRPAPAERQPVDLVGVALLCPGFAAAVYGLSQAGPAGFGAARVVTGLAAGGALLAGYALHALRSRGVPLIDLRLFASRSFTATVSVMFLVGVALFSLMFVLPLYWQQARGHGVLAAGLLLSPLGVGTMVSLPLAGRMSDRVGARLLVPVGAALAGLSLLGYAGAGASTSEAGLAACSLVAGLGLGFVAAPTMGSVYRTVPGPAVSSATGAIVIARQLGASLGIAVMALVVQGRTDAGATPVEAFGTSFRWLVAGAAIVLVAGLSLPGRPRADAGEAVAPSPEPASAHGR